jgi:hypothetical protein
MTRRPFGALQGRTFLRFSMKETDSGLWGVKALRCVFLTIFPHTAGMRR